MTEQATMNVSAEAAAVVTKAKRVVSPEATAALALHRERATLGMAILAVLEGGVSGDLATLKPLAEQQIKDAAAAKAAAEAERKANPTDRGAALAEYRAKTNDALLLLEHLKASGVDVSAALAEARAKQAPAA